MEDECIISLALASTLRNFGYSISGVASSGEKAIDIALARKPDIILMDIRLKGEINGVEAAQEINNHIQTPILYLSASAELLKDANIEYPFSFLDKPFNEDQLIYKMESMLEERYGSCF